jgi:hypothetical protein
MAQAHAHQISGNPPAAWGVWGLGAVAALLPMAWLAPAWAGPVVCTTTLEAPAGAKPVDVTRCGVVVSTPEVVEQRFFTYTAPFAPGIDITHQLTDLLGISLGGGSGSGAGSRVMGFGFPDQTIVWDGTALQNTYQVLLEQQSDPLPWRTADVGNGFGASLATGGTTQRSGAWNDGSASFRAPVRGLW